MCNPSLLLARIIFWKKILRIYEKNFSQVWLQWDSNLHCQLWMCQVSNAIKETKPKVQCVFTLRHQATLAFMVNLLDFIKHLFRDGEMNFLRDISETTQCQ